MPTSAIVAEDRERLEIEKKREQRELNCEFRSITRTAIAEKLYSTISHCRTNRLYLNKKLPTLLFQRFNRIPSKTLILPLILYVDPFSPSPTPFVARLDWRLNPAGRCQYHLMAWCLSSALNLGEINANYISNSPRTLPHTPSAAQQLLCYVHFILCELPGPRTDRGSAAGGGGRDAMDT